MPSVKRTSDVLSKVGDRKRQSFKRPIIKPPQRECSKSLKRGQRKHKGMKERRNTAKIGSVPWIK